MALAGLAGAGLGGAAVYTVVRDRLNEPAGAAATPAPQAIVATPQPQPVGIINTSVNIDTAVTEAVDKVGPAVVTVINQTAAGQRGSGSGVVRRR